MKSRVALWGGSCAIRLLKMAVETLGLHEGEIVELQIQDGALLIRPGKPNYSLEALVEIARGQSAPEPEDERAAGAEAL
ncbi:MAG: AbrB/MazE/SpoVT family DNA-binding domain-containing protein [Pseudomonadota bacterium]